MLRKEAIRTFPVIGVKLIWAELSVRYTVEEARLVVLMILVVFARINELSVAVRY